MLFNSASVLVTEDCNLRCTYCFEEHNKSKMTIETAEKMLLWLFDNESKQGGNNVSVTLFGGEPTLNPEVCCYILNKGYELSKSTNIGFSSNMITNSTFLPEELGNTIRKLLGKIDISVQLSVDGTPDVQDEYRVFPSGKGSWAVVEKTIEKWKVVFKDFPDSLNIHGCLNKKTIHNLYKSYKFFKYDLKIPKIWFLPVCEENWDMMDVAVYREQNSLIYQDILSDVKRTDSSKPVSNIAPFDRSFNQCSTIADKPCAAGDTYCCVTANGDIYPCHQFYFHEDGYQMKLGSLDDGVDYDRARLFQEYDGSDLDCDESCDHGNCFRCIAVNWGISGSILTQRQGVYCDMMKVDQHFQQLISEELKNMSLLNKNDECGQHTSDITKGCDVVSGCDDGSCKTPDKELFIENSGMLSRDDTDVLVKILLYQKNIMKEIQDLKVGVEVLKRSKD